MGVIVQFDYASWVARYPEFVNIASLTAQEYFNEATLYHANDGSGPIRNPQVQSQLLNMLTSHIAWLNSPIDPTEKPNSSGNIPSSPLVGRISSANQGSVSVSTENSHPEGTPQWYQQTKYGSAYWAATGRARMARYVRPVRRAFGPPGWGGRR